MRIKTLALFFIASIIFLNTNAQIHWGVKGGGNLSAALVKDGLTDGFLKTKLIPGFHVGGFAEIPLSQKFALQPALLFTTKGFKVDKDGFAEFLFNADKITFTSYYIELPVNLIYKIKSASGSVLIGLGPYIAYGLGGNWNAEVGSAKRKGKLKFINDISLTDSSLLGSSGALPFARKFDLGANLLLGYEFNSNFFIHLNGQGGLIDVQPWVEGTKDGGAWMSTVGGGLSIGYKF